MMRLCTTFLVFLLLHHAMRAQGLRKEIFSLKPALGINGCQIHGDSYSGYDKPGFFGGMAVNASLGAKTSLELGFYFSQKGARHNSNPEKGDYSFYLLNLNYLDLPLSIRYLFHPKYFVTAGPSFAYLISYYENINNTNMTGSYEFNPYEIGLNIGLGRVINKRFSVELRCSNSISTIRDYGVVSNVFYPNPVARFFNEGFYSNILTLFFAYHIELSKQP